MANSNLAAQERAFFGSRWYDLPGNANDRAQGEERYESIYFGGFDPAFNRLAGTVTVTYATGAVETKKNPTLDEYQKWETAYLADSGYSDLETNTVTVIAGAAYFVTPQNPSQPPAQGFPCPPSVAEIFTGRDQSSVGEVLTKAGELFPKTGREEGGWIYMNRKGRLTARLNERGGQNVTGLGMAIDLSSPPVIRGSIVVATFHTHDLDMDPSMPTGEEISIPNDIWTNEAQGVPGVIIGAGLVRGFNGYGPKRGYWRQPLPKRCEK